jgi:hypothetical protein
MQKFQGVWRYKSAAILGFAQNGENARANYSDELHIGSDALPTI